MRAALCWDQRVDLVHDHGLDRTQRVPRLRRQQEKERLRRGDEDVRRGPQHPRPLARGSVSGADADDRNVQRLAARRDARQRRAQVALHVHRQRLERRDVQNSQPRFFIWRRREHQPVDRRQKGSECLARSRGREEQSGETANDRRPAKRLRLRGRGERGLEPPPYGWVEAFQWRGRFLHLFSDSRIQRVPGNRHRERSKNRAS
jgi:hypothetical protein